MSTNVAFAVSVKDSTTVNKPWKISQQQFLAQYGKDDTSKAIINYYFSRQKKMRNTIVIFTGLAAVDAAIFLHADFKTKPGTDSAGYAVFFAGNGFD